MPQLIAGFHSFVGAAATLVGLAKYGQMSSEDNHSAQELVESYIAVFFGALTQIAAAHGLYPIPAMDWRMR